MTRSFEDLGKGDFCKKLLDSWYEKLRSGEPKNEDIFPVLPFLLLDKEVADLRRDLESQVARFLEEKADWDGALMALLRVDLAQHIQAIRYINQGNRDDQSKVMWGQREGKPAPERELGVSFLESIFRILNERPADDNLVETHREYFLLLIPFLQEKKSGRLDERPKGSQEGEPLENNQSPDVSDSLPEKMEPAEFLNCCSSALKIAASVLKASRILHYLGLGDENSSKGSDFLLNFAKSIIDRLRQWLDTLARSYEVKEDRTWRVRYSEPIRNFLRGEIDKTDLDLRFP